MLIYKKIRTKNLILNKKSLSKCWYLCRYGEKIIFQKGSNKCLFLRNLGIYGVVEKNDYSKVILLNVICLELLVFTNICIGKSNLSNLISQNVLFSKCWYLRISDIEYKNDFSKVISKNVNFRLTKCWYLRRYGQKTIFSKWCQNIIIIKKNWIFTNLCTKTDFFKIIWK